MILQALVLVPLATVAVVALGPEEYRSSAEIAFTGRNTGTVRLDLRQAREAARRDPTLAARTLDVTGIADISPAELHETVELDSVAQGLRLAVAVNADDPFEAEELADEYARQLAVDQRTSVYASSSPADEVAPRLLESGLLGLALAIPLGAAFAAVAGAVRRRAAST